MLWSFEVVLIRGRLLQLLRFWITMGRNFGASAATATVLDHCGTWSAVRIAQVHTCRLQQQFFLAVHSTPLKAAHVYEQKLLVLTAKGFTRVLFQERPIPINASRVKMALNAFQYVAFWLEGTRRY